MQAMQGREFVWTNFPKTIPATPGFHYHVRHPHYPRYRDGICLFGFSQTANYRNSCKFPADNVEVEALQWAPMFEKAFSACTARADAAIFLMNTWSLRRALIGADNFMTVMMDPPLPPQSDTVEPWILGRARSLGRSHGHQRKANPLVQQAELTRIEGYVPEETLHIIALPHVHLGIYPHGAINPQISSIWYRPGWLYLGRGTNARHTVNKRIRFRACWLLLPTPLRFKALWNMYAQSKLTVAEPLWEVRNTLWTNAESMGDHKLVRAKSMKPKINNPNQQVSASELGRTTRQKERDRI
ncbi:hypothetical protein EDD85DRAFT_795823 [Armillaria nabsnona]|nr:hypothetical protein EDD85DRAFT_795823 [Armillaria nabsnona]